MTFANLPAQLIALMLGWTFTVYMQVRSNSRAEALKTREKIVDKLEALSEWVEDELKREEFLHSDFESGYAGLLSQIELKISNLNTHIGTNAVEASVLGDLREMEISELKDENKGLYLRVRHAAWNAIDSIDMTSNEKFFMKKGRLAYFKEYVHAYYGVIVAAISLLAVYYVGKIIVG